MEKKHGDQKIIIKIMLLVIVIVLGVLYKVSSSTIIEEQLEGVENQVATTLYKENQGAGGNGGSGGSGSVIPGGGDSGENGSENGGSQSVDKTTVQELPNYATKLDPDGATVSLTTKTVVGQDLDSLKNALVSNNVLSESEASNIDGIVVITGDVSNVGSLEVDASKYCNSGETVIVVTYDEAKKTYSYVGKGAVNTSNRVTASVNGGSSKIDFASVKDDNTIVAGIPSEYYTVSWDAGLSTLGQYLGTDSYTVGSAYSDKNGWKRFVYTNEYGETAYANPYEPGEMHVNKGTSISIQMVSGKTSSNNSRLVLFTQNESPIFREINGRSSTLISSNYKPTCDLIWSLYENGNQYDNYGTSGREYNDSNYKPTYTFVREYYINWTIASNIKQ